ncbi:MAG: hypothetical protein K8W52_02935, partial [Deltaproteobacteria bacterium]|nr:hypothetical protein [Deltaproteobacteria bacterium]
MIAEPLAGTLLGDRFELRSIAAQAPGYVEYRALDSEASVEVGLWWIRPTLIPDGARQDQLIGAAIEQRRMQVPGARKVHGAGRAREGVWVSWQLAQSGGPAPRHGTPAPLPTVTRWIDAACAALAGLHKQGLVHGRLVPDDVVTVGGELRLAGAGLWHGVERAAAAQAWRRWQGYVAPEIAAGQGATPATDAWSVAAIAAALVGGADDATEAMRIVARRHPPLHELFERLLAGDAAGRPTDLAAFAAEARTRATMPYLADDRSGPMRILAAAQAPPAKRAFGQRKGALGPTEPTAVGHASAANTTVDADPMGARAGSPVAPPPAAMPQTFALPTPTVAPPAPVPHAPAVAIAPARAMPLAPPPQIAPSRMPPPPAGLPPMP